MSRIPPLIRGRIAEAVAFERHTIANSAQKEWAGKKTDRRTLTELLDKWWKYHGENHEHGKKEKGHLMKTIEVIGDIAVNRLSKRELMEYRSSRIRAGISAATINRDIYRLSGMFTRLIQFEEFSGPNPVHGLPPLTEDNPEMTFLEEREIAALLNVLEGDKILVTLLCLSTGGRRTEVVTFRPSQVIKGRVTLLKTKNGKKRTVPISPELEKKVKSEASASLFSVDHEKFCEKLRSVQHDLPVGQATHILRHTFASHFMMNGGNIIALQQILGHASINQMMVYAHLTPTIYKCGYTKSMEGRTGVSTLQSH